MRLSDLGEFGLINLIRAASAKYEDPGRIPWRQILLGIGDDAAAWQNDNRIQLATTDTLVQSVHFDLGAITWEELGWKALAVNLSDIAAMGGIPRYALLSLALPAQLKVQDVSEFINSFLLLAAEFGVALVGGNVATAHNIVITVTIIGCSKGKNMLERSAACPGEQIAVTGYVGLAAAGLEMLKGKTISDPNARNILRQAHFKPVPRVKEGQILIEQGVRTAIDISDGLVADLDHVCESSKVSAKINIEQVPVHPVVTAHFPNSRELALSGGEDYELLFTADKATVARARQALGCPVTVIGDITKDELPTRVLVVDSRGTIIPYKKGGWDHFKNAVSHTEFT
ncbi:MAG: thiamine-phosphate kinase [Dehalococcoidia bacterium]|nr:thiamine-phosphate kinase [Dehalococcoidia bacterium]MDH4299151.1 thiamine-phosphate kinase [Dehalococcoidia bacterium]MDH4366863.1 thiamine-phosphate kinase [Dehalococcoidia bacterium]